MGAAELANTSDNPAALARTQIFATLELVRAVRMVGRKLDQLAGSGVPAV